jgi:hypothetical protein
MASSHPEFTPFDKRWNGAKERCVGQAYEDGVLENGGPMIALGQKRKCSTKDRMPAAPFGSDIMHLGYTPHVPGIEIKKAVALAAAFSPCQNTDLELRLSGGLQSRTLKNRVAW